MQKLSSLDAGFIYLETPRTPMHLGGLYVFAAPARPVDTAAWRAHVEKRLHVSRTLRQRLVRVPRDLDHPWWIEDPDFDPARHLGEATLPAPGGWPELMRLAEYLFDRALPLDRPLWEMVLITGLDGVPNLPAGSFALLIKVHHAAVDGVSGEEMVWRLLDAEPEGDSPATPPPWQPESLPAGWQLLLRTGRQTLGLPASLLRLAGRLGGGVVAAGREWLFHGTPLPPLPLQAPATPFNTAVSGRRWFRSLVLPLERIGRLKAVAGCTVNEVVLAVCAGGLRRYLRARDALPERPLIAAVPISIRSATERRSMGNQVSAMLVDLATDEDDALGRLQRIRTRARHARSYTEALHPEHLLDLIPAPAGAAVVQLYVRLRGPDRLGPWFNLFITNVPGPRRPRYLLGAELRCNPGTAPLFDGLGLILVITSCRDTLSLSATGCPQCIPDAEQLMVCLEDALIELETALTAAERPESTLSQENRG